MYDLQRSHELSTRLVLAKKPHQDLDRTIELARMYKAFATGEDLEYMLRRFDRRESEADFDQANRIAQYITKPIVSSLMNPARKVASVRPIVDRVDYGKEDQRAAELRDRLSEWYGGKSVPEYMSTLIDPSDIDPNAFVLLTFDQFDYRKTKPTVFPVKVPCENVYGFEYLNGQLAHLFLGFAIQYETKPASVGADGKVVPAEKADGMRFVMYTEEHAIVYEQVAKERSPGTVKNVLMDEAGNPVAITGNTGVRFTDATTDAVYYLRTEGDVVYAVKFYEHKAGRVPAFRLGCRPDPLTDGRTCVNRWDEAVPDLKRSLKQARELDLSTINHAIPQKLEYVGPCRAKGCNGGSLPGGEECSSCRGSGDHTIKSAQDHITIRRPKNPQDPIWDLEKMIHYVRGPVEVIEQLYTIYKETKTSCRVSVYGVDISSQGNTGKTYEEVVAQNQGLYDALKPLADWWGDTYMTIVHVWASYNDADEGLTVILKMPRSFGFETAATAFAGLKAANESGANNAVKSAMNLTIIDTVLRDDVDAQKKARVQAKFDPYDGKTEATVLALISGGKTTDRSALMWTESATIFRKAEAQYQGDISFYDLSETKQQEVIDKILDEMLAEKEAKAAEAAEAFAPKLGTDIPDDEDMQDEQRQAERAA